LLTNPETYSAEAAWELLSTFEETDLAMVANYLIAEMVTTKNANLSTIQRLVPGRAYRLHDRFLIAFKGIFPRKLMIHAAIYIKEVVDACRSGKMLVQSPRDPYIMVVLFELASDSNFSLQMDAADEFEQIKEGMSWLN
jgi:hypothetical protein